VNKKRTVPAAIAVAVVVGGSWLPSVVSVSAATAPMADGTLHYYETGYGTSQIDSVVVTGAFTDHGVDHVGFADNGNINKIVLSKGSFEANVTTLNAKVAPTSYDATTCSIVLSGTAPAALSDGTGAYAGITGNVTVTVHEAAILPKLKSGKCNESQNVVPTASVVWVTGSGTVSFK
jgi:hypothetical protein